MIKTARRSDVGVPSSQAGDPFEPSGQAHFRSFCPVGAWEPPINLYRLGHRLDVCVDLAGVEPGSVSVRVETDRLVIEGDRSAPQPAAGSDESMRIMTMEIDHGPFCRNVPLPQDVDHTRISVQYTQGLLWVRVPVSPRP